MTPAVIWAIVIASLGILAFTAVLIVTNHSDELRSLILFGTQFALQIIILFKLNKNGPSE